MTWLDAHLKISEFVGITSAAEKPVVVEPQAPAPVANVDMTQYQVQLVDLKSTLSLYEIPRRAIIDGVALAALKNWMRTLSKYAPGTTPMRRLLYRMNEWIWTVDDSLLVDDWTKKLEEIQLDLGNPLPEKVEWIACIGSKPNLRGYTCGLWTTAHAITVEAYKTEANNPLFNPVNDVMEPFHQFIFHFLSCAECAKNFDKETKKHHMLQVSTREEMVMWFWRVHNFVNTRLSGSRSDDPRFPKRQFPPSVVCSQCYDSSGSFDEKEIFKFMLSYYSDIRQDSVQAPPEYKMNEYMDGKLQGVGARHLNPKFAVNAKKVDKLEETEERLRKVLDASPQREWKDIEGYGKLIPSSDEIS
ncbi:Erv1 / Alr family protein, partial [Cooperia oncophora]